MSAHHLRTTSQHLLAFILTTLIALCVAPAGAALAAPASARLAPPDASPGAALGLSVAVDGDTAVVGAPGDGGAGPSAGAAYVFHLAGGAWAQEARLTGHDTGAFDRFGASVALSRGTLVVGAYTDTPSGPSSGAAYVFVREGGGWREQARLTAPDGSPYARFGWAVGVERDWAVVGAYGDSSALPGAGSAYVFRRSGEAWDVAAKLTAADATPYSSFGYSVAVGSGRVVVGSPYASALGGAAGLAYVFQRREGGWLQEARLAPPELLPGDMFGRSVAIGGRRVLVGAPAALAAQPRPGRAFAFEPGDGGAWREAGALTSGAAAAGDMFGWSVAAASRGQALVGAYAEGQGGAAYGFVWREGRWLLAGRLAPDAPAGQQYGWSVAASRGRAIVGAPGEAPAGAAYAFFQTPGDDHGGPGDDGGGDDGDHGGPGDGHGGAGDGHIEPIVECVAANGDGTYTATFGYRNDSGAAVQIPVGPGNRFDSGGDDHGQPTVFLPGRQRGAFSVRFARGHVAWSVGGRVAVASRVLRQRCDSSA